LAGRGLKAASSASTKDRIFLFLPELLPAEYHDFVDMQLGECVKRKPPARKR
jgi:hypothetical protein